MSTWEPWEDARAKIEAALPGLGIASNRVAWPNESFNKPQPPTPFLEIEIAGGPNSPIELGQMAVWQQTGVLYVHVLWPLGQGASQALGLANDIANIFRGLAAAPVRYRDTAITSGMPTSDDGAYHRISVSVDFLFQDVPV